MSDPHLRYELEAFSGLWLLKLIFDNKILIYIHKNREEAENMCKMMASSNYALLEHEDLGNYIENSFINIDNVEDKRIHATMYPVNATNLYKACLAGVRR